MTFGSDADGDPTVLVATGFGGGTFTGPTFTLEASGGGYHLYTLVFYPVAGSADLFVDGTEQISNYLGHTVGAGSKEVDWGGSQSTTTGQGNYNLIQWNIVPEPSTALLLASGLVAMAVGRRRRAL